MTTCPHDPAFRSLERLRQGELDPATARAARAHLRDCADCGAEAHARERTRALLALVRVHDQRGGVTPEEANRIVHRARSRSPRPSGTWALAFVASAAVVIVGLWAASLGEMPAPPRAPHRTFGPLTTPDAAPPSATAAEALPPGGAMDVAAGASRGYTFADGSTILLRGPARAVVRDAVQGARIELQDGEVACSVRPQGGGRSFEVRAGETLVRVVGTRFVVRRSNGRTTVAVQEGTVLVTEGGHTRALRPEVARGGGGRRGARRPPAVAARATSTVGPAGAALESPEDTVGRARALLSQRRCADARALLEPHRRAHPEDGRALYWLGEAQRLCGDTVAARHSYEDALAHSTGLLADNAMVSIALLAAPEGPRAALAAWSRYLALHPDGLQAAEALLHRARALEELGRHAEARVCLRDFLERHPEHAQAASVRARLAR